MGKVTLMCECGIQVQVNHYKPNPNKPYMCARCRMKGAPAKTEAPVAQGDATVVSESPSV